MLSIKQLQTKMTSNKNRKNEKIKIKTSKKLRKSVTCSVRLLLTKNSVKKSR